MAAPSIQLSVMLLHSKVTSIPPSMEKQPPNRRSHRSKIEGQTRFDNDFGTNIGAHTTKFATDFGTENGCRHLPKLIDFSWFWEAKTLPDPPREAQGAQEGPRWVPGGSPGSPGGGPRPSKGTPGAPQGRPGEPQGSPKGTQKLPEAPPRG